MFRLLIKNQVVKIKQREICNSKYLPLGEEDSAEGVAGSEEGSEVEGTTGMTTKNNREMIDDG